MSTSAPTADPDAGKSLHDSAVDAVQDIHRLQTGLAHAGASPQAVQALGAMVSTLTEIVKALAQSPHVEEASKSGPEDAQPAPEQGPPNNTPGATGGPPPGGPFGGPSAQLQQAMNGGKPTHAR